MKAIAHYFLDLCLLRASPEALPANWLLFWVLLPAQMAINVALVGDNLGGLDKAMLGSLVDVGILLGGLWLGLRFMGHPGRLQQAATALLGCGVLLGLILLPLQWAASSQLGENPEPGAEFLAVLLVALTIWSAIVNGNILRHALGVRLGLGVALAFTLMILSTLLISMLFPAVLPVSP